MSKPIVLAACHDAFPIDLTVLDNVLGERYRIVEIELPWKWDQDRDHARFGDLLKQASGMVLRTGRVSRQVLAAMPSLQAIACHGRGVDQVDLEAAKNHGVIVTNTPGANAEAVADYTLGLLMALLKGFANASAHLLRTRDWDGARFLGHDLTEKTVGLVGCGHIGTAFGKRCLKLGMNVMACRRNPEKAMEPGFETVSTEELFQRSDVLSLHLPFTKETQNYLDQKKLLSMPAGSFVINTARGELLCLDALNEALRNGHIAGAALDVFPDEPPDFSHPIFNAPNLIATPHMAASTPSTLSKTARMAAQDVWRVLQGEVPLYRVG